MTAIIPHSPLLDLIPLVTNAVSSPTTKRIYTRAMLDFFAWVGPRQFTRATVQEYRAALEGAGKSSASVNQSLTAIKKLASEASAHGYIPETIAGGIASVPGVKRLGVRSGNWLTLAQSEATIYKPPATLKGLRDRAILCLLIGCGLRRGEATALTVGHLQSRDDHYVLADIIGKHGRVRTVPVPDWTAETILDWLRAANLKDGLILRSMDRWRHLGEGMSEQAVLDVVERYAPYGVRPHDLRRTFAKLARKGGADIDQIQAALGHASLSTTTQYIGNHLDLERSACDRLGINKSPRH